jgi:hypothetical protein
MSRDETHVWTACNEITHRLARNGRDSTNDHSHAVAWAMLVEGLGWFGRIGEDWSFGPTSLRRAKEAVEAFLRGELFDKFDGERSWRGDCGRFVNLASAA